MKGIKAAAKDAKVKKVMHEWKQGKLHSGSKKGPVVKDQAQAVAIALESARKAKPLSGGTMGIPGGSQPYGKLSTLKDKSSMYHPFAAGTYGTGMVHQGATGRGRGRHWTGPRSVPDKVVISPSIPATSPLNNYSGGTMGLPKGITHSKSRDASSMVHPFTE